ncbi:MAG TPA: MFS transporter [Saprospiraceae bacterium]|nr:MFS transporter [Saprospiraceae bacterium]HNT18991.1 MFS transporter [Saprospiraceae bacterium]
MIPKNDKKLIHAWAMYDWANSVYALVITSAIFPAYYNSVTRNGDHSRVSLFGIQIENTAAYAINLGIAFGIVALLSPLLSSISDYSGNQKNFMRFFCYLGAAGCISLFFFTGSAQVYLGLGGMMLATIGYSGSIVFYNSYLPVLATEDRQDKVSARGYAYGYLGSTTLLILVLFFILNQNRLGISDETLLPRLSFLITGCWWMGFAQISFNKLPRGLNVKPVEKKYLFHGYLEMLKIWRRLKTEKNLRTFLAGFFFYIMGVQTVMFMAASFGEKEIHLNMMNLILTVLILEYIAIPGAFLFAWISKKWGNIRSLSLAVMTWILICIAAYFISTAFHFYLVALFIGLVMGGIQSLSRSTYSKLIPKTGNNAGYFSFYDVCEKMAMMCGLVLFGYLDHASGSMRGSILALALWFIIGLTFLISLFKDAPLPHTNPDRPSIS